MIFDLIIVGGGAAGFFAANQVLEKTPEARVLILEKGTRPLDKVRISGGGRCNVTHACFDPRELVGYYPRGGKELLGPFHKFQPGDTIAWFDEQGIELKTEDDGRMFPTTNSSETIVAALQGYFEKAGGKMNTSSGVRTFVWEEGRWKVTLAEESIESKFLLLCPGASRPIWDHLRTLGHGIVHPVPSLFTFKCKDSRITDLAGLVAQNATISVVGSSFEESGPLLITHWGMSGPAVLKLSSRGARYLADQAYKFTVKINWIAWEVDEVIEEIKNIRTRDSKQLVSGRSPFGLSARLWKSLLHFIGIDEKLKWAELSKAKAIDLANVLTMSELHIDGKSTFKEEFVTAGGVELKEVNFQTMESKVIPNLYFAGEILNIDALTGGFNFQSAWTTGFLAGTAIAAQLEE